MKGGLNWRGSENPLEPRVSFKKNPPPQLPSQTNRHPSNHPTKADDSPTNSTNFPFSPLFNFFNLWHHVEKIKHKRKKFLFTTKKCFKNSMVYLWVKNTEGGRKGLPNLNFKRIWKRTKWPYSRCRKESCFCWNLSNAKVGFEHWPVFSVFELVSVCYFNKPKPENP